MKYAVIKEEYIELFKELGYDVQNKGIAMYCSIIDDVRDMIAEGNNDKEIRSELDTIYRELYRFYFEVGRGDFFEAIDKFRKTMKLRTRKNGEELAKMGLQSDGYDLGLEESIIYFAKFFSEKDKNNTRKVAK